MTEFVLAECASRSVGSAKYIVCGLRSLLRYLYVAGHTATALEAAVPKVASWRLARVPVTFGRAEVVRLFASCDRRNTFGRRDLGFPRNRGGLLIADGAWQSPALSCHRFDPVAAEAI